MNGVSLGGSIEIKRTNFVISYYNKAVADTHAVMVLLEMQRAPVV